MMLSKQLLNVCTAFAPPITVANSTLVLPLTQT